jgi:hypothetical protein
MTEMQAERESTREGSETVAEKQAGGLQQQQQHPQVQLS